RPLKQMGRNRITYPYLEVLENRTLPATGLPLVASNTAVSFDPGSGLLSILGSGNGTHARVAVSSDGALAVTINGQTTISSDPAAQAFDARLRGANSATLHQINLEGGSLADTLDLQSLTTASKLAATTDGTVSVSGSVNVAGAFAVNANSLGVD